MLLRVNAVLRSPIVSMIKGSTIWILRMSIGEVCLIKYLRRILKYELPIPKKNISSLDIYIFYMF